MPYTLLLHIANEDPVVLETDDLPGPTDQWIKGSNPRRKDNKDLHYLMPDVTTVIFPTWRINFIEIMPGKDEEEIITVVRDDRQRGTY
jgi:hypothetical protein